MKRLEGPPFSRTIAPFFLLGIVEPPDYRRPPELVLELVPSTSPRISPPPRSRSRGPRWGEAPHHPHLPPPQFLFPPSNHSPLSFSLFLHNSSSLSAAQSFHWELGILGESTWNIRINGRNWTNNLLFAQHSLGFPFESEKSKTIINACFKPLLWFKRCPFMAVQPIN